VSQDAPDRDVVVVLVASDDAGTRAQVALTLGASRFEVAEATGTDDAIRAIATRRPDVLVVDANLPGAGAAALARSARAQPETADTRVLLLTGRDAASVDGGGAIDASLAVPFTAFALLRKVDALLDGSDRWAPGGPLE
jgi:DNA-binding response OmpR family regulator